jgi:hypothetical protein
MGSAPELAQATSEPMLNRATTHGDTTAGLAARGDPAHSRANKEFKGKFYNGEEGDLLEVLRRVDCITSDLPDAGKKEVLMASCAGIYARATSKATAAMNYNETKEYMKAEQGLSEKKMKEAWKMLKQKKEESLLAWKKRVQATADQAKENDDGNQLTKFADGLENKKLRENVQQCIIMRGEAVKFEEIFTVASTMLTRMAAAEEEVDDIQTLGHHQRCHHCGEEGHFARNCPNRATTHGRDDGSGGSNRKILLV